MAEAANAALEALSLLEAKLAPTLLLVLTDRVEVAAEALKRSRAPVLLATSSADVADECGPRARRVVPVSDPPAGGLGTLPLVKEILLGAYLDGVVRAEDRVLCVATGGDALVAVGFFDVARDLELGHLRAEVGTRVPMAVVERALRLAAELSREGREGKPVGTLFVLGDTEAVLARSRPAVLNPFEGHPESKRSLLDEAVWETAKEFAQLDGAFVVREDGVIVAAGRYVTMEGDAEVAPGLGGRHIAAAGVTRATKAIAIAVSSNGAIRVFKDGRVVMMVGKL